MVVMMGNVYQCVRCTSNVGMAADSKPRARDQLRRRDMTDDRISSLLKRWWARVKTLSDIQKAGWETRRPCLFAVPYITVLYPVARCSEIEVGIGIDGTTTIRRQCSSCSRDAWGSKWTRKIM